MASLTRVIFSASSSGISMPNSSSNAMINSTVSSESAPRSSTKEASAVTSSASTPSCSTMMDLTLSSTDIDLLLVFVRARNQNARLVLAQKTWIAERAPPPRIRYIVRPVPKRIFSYEEAAALLPEVQQLTAEAAEQVDALPEE